MLRQLARPVLPDEITSPQLQQTIANMLETLRLAPGVGLAAPQIGLSLQLAIIEDRSSITPLDRRAVTRTRPCPVDFHVLINPRLEIDR